MARATVQRLPFSGAGGRMTSSALLMVEMAALAAMGVGEDDAGSSPSTRTASTSLPSATPGTTPVEPKFSGSVNVPVIRTSPVAVTGATSGPPSGFSARISAFGVVNAPVAAALRDSS